MSMTLSAGSPKLRVSLTANSKKLEVTLAASTGDVRLLPLHLTPTVDSQSVTADPGKAFNKVDMDGIPYHEIRNEYGTTIVIG